MNPVPASVKAPRLPQVNLVPPEIALKKARGRQRAVAMVLILLFVLILGAFAFWLETVKSGAEAELEVVNKERDDIQAEMALYSDVPRVKALLENSQAARSYAGATEIDIAEFFDLVLAELTPGSVFDTVSFERTTVDGNAPAATSPFARPDIGEVTFTGWTPTALDVAALTTRLESVPGIESVRTTMATRALEEASFEQATPSTDVVYTFTIVARITVEALTERFAPDAGEETEEPSEGDSNEGEES